MMANMFAVSPILRLRRSAQSGNYAMTIAWQTVYVQVQNFAWMFGSGKLDLTNMIAGDHIDVRVSSRQTLGGAWILEDQFDYDGVQPTAKPKVIIGSILDTFGVMIEMRQTLGALIQIYCEFFEALR